MAYRLFSPFLGSNRGMSIIKSMIHLHTRSSYSLLESPLRIESIIALAKEAGQSAVALTDHFTMYGTMAFIKAAKEAGLKPIIGLEFDVLYQCDSLGSEKLSGMN